MTKKTKKVEAGTWSEEKTSPLKKPSSGADEVQALTEYLRGKIERAEAWEKDFIATLKKDGIGWTLRWNAADGVRIATRAREAKEVLNALEEHGDVAFIGRYAMSETIRQSTTIDGSLSTNPLDTVERLASLAFWADLTELVLGLTPSTSRI